MRTYITLCFQIYKKYGGIESFSVEDIIEEQFEEIKIYFPDSISVLTEKNDKMRDQFLNVANKKLILEAWDSLSNDTAIQVYRESFNLGPKILNNIKPPNVLQQIYNIVQKVFLSKIKYQQKSFFIQIKILLIKRIVIFVTRKLLLFTVC